METYKFHMRKGEPDLKRKRVLLLSEGFGTGHTQAAHALAISLRRHSPDVQTRVIELGAFLHPMITPWILTAYRKTVVSQPKLIGLIYRSQYKNKLNRLAQLALHRLFYKQTASIIRQLRPDTVVCTHPLPNAVIARLKRLGLEVPLCTVITDYDAHGTWINSEVNKYLVSTDEVKQKLIYRGVAAETVEVTGIPVHPNFRQHHDKADIRARFHLREMPTVMVMCGGWGLVKNVTLYMHMAQWCEQIQMIFCLGSNDKVRVKLMEDPLFHHPHIHLLGYTTEIDKLMDVSDLLITKPGGMTCTEGMTKGIPMLFYNPIPGQEEENCHYFTKQGFGMPLQTIEDIDRWFRILLDQYNSLSSYRQRMQQTACASGSTLDYCAQSVMQLLESV